MQFTISLPISVPESEFSGDFVQAMADRMAVSFFKYGRVKDAYPSKVNALECLKQRLKLYLEGGVVKGETYAPGNLDFLFDAANFAMIEYMAPALPDVYLRGGDTAKSPGRVWNNGTTNEKKNVVEYKYKREGD